jgi:hypothetical protein
VAISSGTLLGRYEIVALIGSGGWGRFIAPRMARCIATSRSRFCPRSWISDQSRFLRGGNGLAWVTDPQITQMSADEGDLILAFICVICGSVFS